MIRKNPDGRLVIDPNILTEEQRDRFPTVQWLINPGPRGTGRTFLLALAFIQRALDAPGERVCFWDHSDTRGNMSYLEMQYKLMEIVKAMQEELRRNNISISIGEKYVRAEWKYYYSPKTFVGSHNAFLRNED